MFKLLLNFSSALSILSRLTVITYKSKVISKIYYTAVLYTVDVKIKYVNTELFDKIYRNSSVTQEWFFYPKKKKKKSANS